MVLKVGNIFPRYRSAEPTEVPNTSFHLYIYKPLKKSVVWIWEVTLLALKGITKIISSLFSAIFFKEDAPLKWLADAISNCVRPIYEKLCRVFSRIKNASSALRTYAFFQAIETLVPGPLKALANTCYIYSRDLFTNIKDAWNDQTPEIRALIQEKETLQRRYKEAVEQIDQLIRSRQNFLDMGLLDQATIDNLIKEKTAIQEQLRLSEERNELGHEREVNIEAQAASLREEIALLRQHVELLVNKTPILPLSSEENEKLKACLLKDGQGSLYNFLTLGVSCP